MPFNQLTTAPPSETRWFLYLPWQPTWILAPGMSLFFSLNLISCCCLVAKSCQTLLRPHVYLARLLCLSDFPGKNIRVGCPFPLPGKSSPPGDQTCLPCIGIWVLYHWATVINEMLLNVNLLLIFDFALQSLKWNHPVQN